MLFLLVCLLSAATTDSKTVNGDVENNALFPSTSAKAHVDSADEFSALVNNGKPFLEGMSHESVYAINSKEYVDYLRYFFAVCEQMRATIEKIISASGDPNKIIENLKAFRKNCSSKDAKPYNECISKVKNLVSESENSALWELIRNGTLLVS